eukprot:scaffold60798_cov30-Tisochrysis_lutea.AAC.1
MVGWGERCDTCEEWNGNKERENCAARGRREKRGERERGALWILRSGRREKGEKRGKREERREESGRAREDRKGRERARARERERRREGEGKRVSDRATERARVRASMVKRVGKYEIGRTLGEGTFGK